MEAYNIDTCAVLIEVATSVWTARKLDKSATMEVIASNEAGSSNAARVNKNLLAGRPELDVIAKHVGEARGYLYSNTLPWSDGGMRLLPTRLFPKVSTRMGAYRDTFYDLVDEFVKVYPTLITAQALALGNMFRREDFPTAAEIEHKFAFRINYQPVPNAGDFRVDVGNEAAAYLREQLEEAAKERANKAAANLRERLREHMERMSDRLTTDVVDGEAKQRRFTDTLVQGAYDLCDIAESLNITGDSTVEQARNALLRALDGASAEDLRKDSVARDGVKKEVDAILAKFSF